MTDISPDFHLVDLPGIGQQQEDNTPESSSLSGHPPAKEIGYGQEQKKR